MECDWQYQYHHESQLVAADRRKPQYRACDDVPMVNASNKLGAAGTKKLGRNRPAAVKLPPRDNQQKHSTTTSLPPRHFHCPQILPSTACPRAFVTAQFAFLAPFLILSTPPSRVAMLRSAVAPRSLLRSLTTTTTTTSTVALKSAPLSSQCRSAASLARRPHIAAPTKVWGALLQARRGYAMDNIDKEREAKIGEKKLPSHPDLVSGASSTHPIMTEIGQKNEEKKAQQVNEEGETEMMAGVKHDLVGSVFATGCCDCPACGFSFLETGARR
nr:hypothetical protein CFP56_00547 [Quercus suber]